MKGKLTLLPYQKCLKTKSYYVVFLLLLNCICYSQNSSNLIQKNEKKIMIYIDKSIESGSDSKAFDIKGLYKGMLEEVSNGGYTRDNCDFDDISIGNINPYDYYEKKITDFFSFSNCFDFVPMVFFANNFESTCSGENFKVCKGESIIRVINNSVRDIINLINSSLQYKVITNINKDIYLIMSNFYVEDEIDNQDKNNVDYHLLIFSGNQDYWCNNQRIALLKRLKPPRKPDNNQGENFFIKFCFENNSYECKLIEDYGKY